MDLASLDPALNSTEVVNQPKHGKTLGKEHKQKQNLNNNSFGNSTSSQNDAGGIAVGLDEGERDGSGEGVGALSSLASRGGVWLTRSAAQASPPSRASWALSGLVEGTTVCISSFGEGDGEF